MSTAAGGTSLLRAPTQRRRRPDVRARHPSMAPRRRHPAMRSPEELRRNTVRRQLRGVASSDFRPDVEGMRALAVIVVVLFHLRIGVFKGGFVGVDVFFVLSGFLITRLLLNELAASGTIALPNFWARRARRLLPASVLVIVATLVAGRWMLSPIDQRALAGDATAAGGFVVNFVFAHRSSDYFDSQTAHSPLLHFWSLAVEEQFYLLWPLVIVLLARRPRQYRRLLLRSSSSPRRRPSPRRCGSRGTTTRWRSTCFPHAWASSSPARRSPRPGRRSWWSTRGTGPGWRGSACSASRSRCSRSKPMRDSRARRRCSRCSAPCSCSSPGERVRASIGPARFLGHPGGLWIGRHSYAIYLWHWPVLVLFEAQFGSLSLPVRIAVVLLSVGLAAVSLRLVEDPVRHSRWLAADPRRGLVLGAALCAVALGAASLREGQRAAARLRNRRGGTDAARRGPGFRRAHVAGSLDAGGRLERGRLGRSGDDDAGHARPARAGRPRVAGGGEPQCAGTGTCGRRRTVEPPPGTRGGQLRSSAGLCRRLRRRLAADRADPVPLRRRDLRHHDRPLRRLARRAMVARTDRDGRGPRVRTHRPRQGGCPVSAVAIPNANSCPTWRDRAIEFIATERPDLVVVSQLHDYPDQRRRVVCRASARPCSGSHR